MKTPKNNDYKVKLWSDRRKKVQRFFLKLLQYAAELFAFYIFVFAVACYFLPMFSSEITNAVMSVMSSDSSGSLLQMFSLVMLPSLFLMLALFVFTCLIIYKVHKGVSKLIDKILDRSAKRNEEMYKEQNEK